MAKLLVIIPHPDDESYAFGGTMALAAAAGWRVIVEAATNGELGKRHDGIVAEPISLGNRRRDELRDSCRVLGAELPRFWDLPDGGLADEEDQSARVAALLRAEEPNLVLALGADGAYGHPDHIAVYRWVTGGFGLLGEAAPPLLLASFPRGLFLPQYELCVGMLGDPPQPPRAAIGSNEPDVRLPISSARAQKLASIAAHRTQLWRADPNRLFPRGIIRRLLDEERYTVPNGTETGDISAAFADFAAASPPRIQRSRHFETALTKRLQNLVRRVTDQGKP